MLKAVHNTSACWLQALSFGQAR